MAIVRVLARSYLREGDPQEVYLNTDRVVCILPPDVARENQTARVILDPAQTVYLDEGGVRRLVEAHNQGGLRERERLVGGLEILREVLYPYRFHSTVPILVLVARIEALEKQIARLDDEWYRQPDTPGVENQP